MATDQDLMGFGLNAFAASRLADSSSTQAITPAASGSTYATSTILQGNQFFTYSTAATGGWIGLPVVGGSDNAARIADDFTFLNLGAGAVTVACPTGVTLWLSGTAGITTAGATVAKGHTLQFIAANTTNWAGFLG